MSIDDKRRIEGVGIDVADMERFADKGGDAAFLERLFTIKERADMSFKKNIVGHIAQSFAAKEAIIKALGNLSGKGVNWVDIEIENSPDAGLVVNLHNAALKAGGGKKIFLSVACTKKRAVAFAVAEQL